MVTLEDVALQAGVSRSTVSRVVNGDESVRQETRQRVERVIQQSGYVPHPAARALASNQSQAIGLILPSYQDTTFGTLLGAVQQETKIFGKNLLTEQGGGSAESEWLAIQRLLKIRCENLILHLQYLPDAPLIELCHRYPNLLFLNRNSPSLRCIPFNHSLASQIATRSLIHAGHTNIACLAGEKQRPAEQDKIHGYQVIMTENRLRVRISQSAKKSIKEGYSMTQALLTDDPPTALYCCHGLLAVGAVLAIQQAGKRIPQDISLICLDSGQISENLIPQLSYVSFPLIQMACHAVRLLLDETQAQKIDFTPLLHLRDSIQSVVIV